MSPAVMLVLWTPSLIFLAATSEGVGVEPRSHPLAPATTVAVSPSTLPPLPFAIQPIESDNTWRTWTHTGSSYAALVVRPGFDPFLRLDVLPQVGGYVLARMIVEGKKKE